MHDTTASAPVKLFGLLIDSSLNLFLVNVLAIEEVVVVPASGQAT
jgi:hypothetical protein|eukprot:COSAG06_NODE_964_length_11305_cov_5.854721_7_plen_45_part_00